MTSPLVVRPLAPPDVPAVAAVHVAAFAEAAPDARERAVSSLNEELARPWSLVRVACLGDGVVGALVAWLVVDEVHVLDVATAPEHRRRGVGRALVADLLALAHGRGARHLYLEVRRSNAGAIALYRDAGFAAVSVRARYYADDEDAVEMSLTLDAAGAPVRREDKVDLASAG